MAGKRIKPVVAISLAIAALALGGCFKSSTTAKGGTGSQVATLQLSVEPTTPASIVTSGPITTPEVGSALRKDLLDAARKRLGVAAQFYVYQLFVQGDTAIGDLDPVTPTKNGRVFVAWEKRGGFWAAIGASKFGTPAANAATTARALPTFTAELIAKIDWKKAKPAAPKSPSTSSSLTEAKAIASLKVAADAWSNTAMSGVGKPYKVTLIKVAQDSAGVWWGHVVTQPKKDATNSFEPLNFWAKYAGGAWSGSVQDPEPPAPSTFFPASVISKLSL